MRTPARGMSLPISTRKLGSPATFTMLPAPQRAPACRVVDLQPPGATQVPAGGCPPCGPCPGDYDAPALVTTGGCSLRLRTRVGPGRGYVICWGNAIGSPKASRCVLALPTTWRCPLKPHRRQIHLWPMGRCILPLAGHRLEVPPLRSVPVKLVMRRCAHLCRRAVDVSPILPLTHTLGMMPVRAAPAHAIRVADIQGTDALLDAERHHSVCALVAQVAYLATYSCAALTLRLPCAHPSRSQRLDPSVRGTASGPISPCIFFRRSSSEGRPRPESTRAAPASGAPAA